MALWSSRTKMEHAKTRAIEVKANGKDHEEDEGKDKTEEEILEEKIKALTTDNLNLERKVSEFISRLEQAQKEIDRLRLLSDRHTEFMHTIILELINKPQPKSAAAAYLEAKTASSGNANTAGPKGKLP